MDEIYRTVNGILSDAHTVGHNAFVGLFVRLGEALGSIRYGITIGCVFQALCASAVVAFVFVKLTEWHGSTQLGAKLNKLLFWFMLVCPYSSLMFITLIKDVPFTLCFILFCLFIIDGIFSKSPLALKQAICLGLSGFGMMFFRHNGVVVFVVSCAVLCVAAKGSRLRYAATFSAVMAAWFLYTVPLFNALNVELSPKEREVFVVPMQHMARVASVYPETLNEQDALLFGDVFTEPVSIVGEHYNYMGADYVKMLANDSYLSNKLGFLKRYISFAARHPLAGVETVMLEGYGYIVPNLDFAAVIRRNPMPEVNPRTAEFNLQTHSLISPLNLLARAATFGRSVPIVGNLFDMGSRFFVVAFMLTLAFVKRQNKLVFAPVLALTYTCTVSSVFGEFRYFYGVWLVAPILLVVYLCLPVREGECAQ